MGYLSGVAKLQAEAQITALKKASQAITNYKDLLISLSYAYYNPESKKYTFDKLANYC